jgi:UDP:flavonoid glycosyltransferase YjiC (YdhE family)
MEKKLLFVSWALGLGHVTRDLAITGELKKIVPGVKVSWLACSPALEVLEAAGERVLSYSERLINNTPLTEEQAEVSHRLNLLRFCIKVAGVWGPNITVLEEVLNREQFDLIVADEAYEVVAALLKRQISLDQPFLAIHDFFGVDSIGNTLLERLGGYLIVRTFHRPNPEGIVGFLFPGEEEDIPNDRFGFLLTNRREWARRHCRFLGYVLPFSPSDNTDRRSVRKKMGYGSEPLILCSIGGTAIGKDLLELCGKTYPFIKKDVPGIRMILVCGPRLKPDSLDVPEGVDVRGYVPDLWEHFAASDLAIVQGGGTTTVELTALRRPFIYFPLEEHFEQELYVAGRLERQGAGIRMKFSQTTPESLAEVVLSNLGKDVHYPRIPTDGARTAAQIINEYLRNSG